jgi:hypothetical protein
MRKSALFLFVFAFFAVLTSCEDITKDEDTPVIDMSMSDAFPKNCVMVYRGEAFNYKVKFTDNIELGSYSIEMHHNFDRHSHSTSITTCDFDPVKSAVKPFRFLREYSIPEKLTSYTATGSIEIPADIDKGDYHFMFRLTDASGWQTFVGISMKIADR